MIVSGSEEKLFFVVETKGGLFGDSLKATEQGKIECAQKHFAAIGEEVGFFPAVTYEDVTNRFRINCWKGLEMNGEDEINEDELEKHIFKQDPDKGIDWRVEKSAVNIKCPMCNMVTSHRTKGVEKENETKKEYEWLECTICDTSQKVYTGKDGADFQENADAPDNSDFEG